MAIQGRRPRWKPSCTSRVFERDQNLFTPGNLVNGPHEGTVVCRV